MARITVTDTLVAAPDEGIGSEEIYILCKDGVTPGTPNGDNPSGWSRATLSVTTSTPCLWWSKRTKSAGTWGAWCKPSLLTRLANDGTEGHRGLMPYPSGVYDSSTTYKSDDYITPMVLDGEQYYILQDPNSTSTGIRPSTNYAAGGTGRKWLLLEKYKAIYVELLMASYGKIASAIFYGDCMFSQQGTDANGNASSDFKGYEKGTFIPNILLNFLTGVAKLNKLIAENAEISGKVKGITGSFKSLDCVNNSGNRVGGIGFGTDGKMWFEGDMFSQGYDSAKGRGYRFYSSDIWCRGIFGARERSVLKVLGSYAYFYPNGLGGTGVYVSLTSKKSSTGDTYYVVPCYGSEGDYSGMPIDIIAFNTSLSLNYELSLNESQRVLVVNCNDKVSIHVYSHGYRNEWPGGSVAEVVRLANIENPATATGTLGKGLFIGGMRDNTWS